MEEERIQKLQEFMKTSVNLLSRTCGDDDQVLFYFILFYFI